MPVAVDVRDVPPADRRRLLPGLRYGLLGVGFALILGVTGRFHFAYSFTYTLAAYLAFTFTFRVGAGRSGRRRSLGDPARRPSSARRSRLASTGRWPRKAGATALLAVFVAALGLGIAGENLMRLLLGLGEPGLLRADARRPSRSGTRSFINFDVWQAVERLVIALALAAMLRYTALGRRIKATRVNPELAKIIGINANRIYIICFFIGTICAGVAAFWYGLQVHRRPGHGQPPVIFAFVVAFLAGTAPLADPGVPHRHRRRPASSSTRRSGCRCAGRRPPCSWCSSAT